MKLTEAQHEHSVDSSAKQDRTNNAGEEVKGFIGRVRMSERDDRIIYHNGKDVYTAPSSNVVDTQTGYLIGRWECSIDQWNRIGHRLWGLPQVDVNE